MYVQDEVHEVIREIVHEQDCEEIARRRSSRAEGASPGVCSRRSSMAEAAAPWGSSVKPGSHHPAVVRKRRVVIGRNGNEHCETTVISILLLGE